MVNFVHILQLKKEKRLNKKSYEGQMALMAPMLKTESKIHTPKVRPTNTLMIYI